MNVFEVVLIENAINDVLSQWKIDRNQAMDRYDWVVMMCFRLHQDCRRWIGKGKYKSLVIDFECLMNVVCCYW